MVLDPEKVGCKGSDVDDADEVRSTRGNWDLKILCVVHQCGLGYRLRPGRIFDINELPDEVLNRAVVPV